jgi:hypothetical protein
MDESSGRTNTEPEFITIVEGPEPEFVSHDETWALSLLEGNEYIGVSRCQLRTYNGPAMVERCRNAWAEGRPVLLDYPNRFGLRRHAQIVAARFREVEQGPLLLLWVRSPEPDKDESD